MIDLIFKLAPIPKRLLDLGYNELSIERRMFDTSSDEWHAITVLMCLKSYGGAYPDVAEAEAKRALIYAYRNSVTPRYSLPGAFTRQADAVVKTLNL